MENTTDDSVWAGCFGGQARAIQPVEGKHVRVHSKTSTLTRWWNGAPPTGETEDVDSAELEFNLAEHVLSQISDDLLGLDLKDEPLSLKTKSTLPEPKPNHERKLSWPFSGARKVAPQPATPKESSEDDLSPGPSPNESANSPFTPDVSVSVSTISDSSELPSSTETAAALEKDPARPQGYRRLWQSITSARKGDKVATADISGQPTEYTVESLVRSVLSLKPSQPIMEATLSSGLHTLDSRAVAALLKELAKAGAQHRATELFDYLRSLPEDDALAPLADLYTYTTVISQCGGHQHLRRALELVAEMRGRGIQCNVHTFSALMSVCVKCK